MGHSFRMTWIVDMLAWIVDMWDLTMSLLISNENQRQSELETILKVEKGIRPFHLMADAEMEIVEEEEKTRRKQMKKNMVIRQQAVTEQQHSSPCSLL